MVFIVTFGLMLFRQEHYEKFLDPRKNADPGITEFEDAKKRLAGPKK